MTSRHTFASRACLAAVLGCFGCGSDGSGADSASAADAPAFSAETTLWTAGPGEEWLQLCQGWPINNDETLYVNKVVLDAIPGIHHSDWIILPEDSFPGYDELVDCADGGEFGLFAGAADGTFIFAQSTQSTHEEQVFGDGAVVEVPPRSQLFVFMHILNTESTTVDTKVGAKLYTLPEAEVQVKLKDLSFNMGSGAIEVKPRQRTRLYAECRFPEPADFNAYFILPHYHDWGTGMSFEIMGGPNDGMVFWENEGSTGEPLAVPVSPPISLQGAEGIRFSCSYDNPGEETIHYSESGDGEMCFFLMHTDADKGWYTIMDDRILPVNRESMGMTDGVEDIKVGPCVPLNDDTLPSF